MQGFRTTVERLARSRNRTVRDNAQILLNNPRLFKKAETAFEREMSTRLRIKPLVQNAPLRDVLQFLWENRQLIISIIEMILKR